MSHTNYQAEKLVDRKVGFLDLPAEIRNDIYERTFSYTEVTITNRGAIARNSGLVLANRQIHKEVVKLYYSLSAFYFETAYCGDRWLRRIPSKYRAEINEVYIDNPYYTHITGTKADNFEQYRRFYGGIRQLKKGAL